jgi:regulator of protease activity HflC (stomatin/prohibitin superfamily)
MEKTKIVTYKRKSIGKYIWVGVILLIGVILLLDSFYTINAGYRGVLLTFGKPSIQSMNEGLHFKIPLAQHIIKMNVQTQRYDAPKASSASKDLQTVTTDVAINYFINPESAPEIYKNIGIAYQDKIIAPAVQEVVKASTSQYTAEELITKRSEVKEKIDIGLRDRLKEFGINIQTISITNFDFSAQFNNAIESKVTAEQNALAAKNKLEQVKYEAQQRITQAAAEAEAIKIQSQAITVSGGKDYVQLQAIERWNGILPQVTGNAIPFINLGGINNSI